ncbi:hypothetical protein SAMN05216436_1168 [bacterium A37T11]|nr:hypothetical protein SAMN05216436_1168 [bacterium A37T11]
MLFFEIRETKVHTVTKKFKNSIIACTVLAFIGIGYVGLNAFTSADTRNAYSDKKTEVKETEVFASAWYGVYSTSSTSESGRFIIGGGAISTPPTTGSDCAQNNTSGNYCAVHLNRPATAPELPDSISVADALASPYNYTLDNSESSGAGDGYARHP